MLRTLFATLLLLATATVATARRPAMQAAPAEKGEQAHIYRFYLKDKHNTPYSIAHPGRFLTRKSIERRQRQNLPVDSTDLPVNPKYVKQFERRGVVVVGTSRWQNTVLVYVRDTAALEPLKQLDCVSRWKHVWSTPERIDEYPKRMEYHERFNDWDSLPSSTYGRARDQILTLGGERLHNIGMRGKGMTIAVIDGGFNNVDRIPVFQQIDIRGSRDFVYPGSPSIFAEGDHGTRVLSALAINQPYIFVGTAPEASYWLLRSEDGQSEQEVEEDYWTFAAEFADSVGADIISSSLGYNEFDDRSTSHRLWQLDGHATYISHSASLLAAKGIILVCSAGNSGMGQWKKLTSPADADRCITVGALTPDLNNAPFSSIGPTQDGRVKPDVMAIGSPASVVNGRGMISQDMGTSFSTPIVCGLVACLWQALHTKTADEIMELIRQSGSNYVHPDNIFGYGIPDFWKAYEQGNLP